MNKVYSRINFQNAPSTATPLNDTNLNKMDKAINELDDRVIELSDQADMAMAIAKGSNNSRSFDTTEMMYAWLSSEANKGVAMIGDKLYVKEAGSKNWWVTEVLTTPNADGRYYEIAELDTEIVDLANVNKAIEELEDEVQDTREHLGISKNILNITKSGSRTVSGISYEYNEDKSCTLNGTATADVNMQVYGGLAVYALTLTEDVIISGCPIGGSEDTYYARMYISHNGSGQYYYDTGEGYKCEVADDEEVILSTYHICVKAGTTLENVTFYPMIRLASETNSDYEPYRKDRVAELESKTAELESDITEVTENISTVNSNLSIKTYGLAEIASLNSSNVSIETVRCGNWVQMRIYVSGGVFEANTNHLGLTLNKLKPLKRVTVPMAHGGGTTIAQIDLQTDGKLYIYVESKGGYYSTTITYLTTDF